MIWNEHEEASKFVLFGPAQNKRKLLENEEVRALSPKDLSCRSGTRGSDGV